MAIRAMEWSQGQLRLLDQTRLPKEIRWMACTDYRQVVKAIQKLSVRGAPAIGVAGAYAVVLAAQELEQEPQDFSARLQRAAEEIRGLVIGTPLPPDVDAALEAIANELVPATRGRIPAVEPRTQEPGTQNPEPGTQTPEP